MHKLLLIIQREFITKVRSKAYLVLIFLSPILMIGMFSAIFYFASKEESSKDKTVSILAVTNSEIVKDLQKTHPNIQLESTSNRSYAIAKALVDEKKYNGLVYTNSEWTVLEVYGDEKVPKQDFQKILDKHWKRHYLSQHQINPKVIETIVQESPVKIQNMDNSKETVQKWVKGTIAIGAGYIVMMFVIIYGNSVMRSIIEEKNSRVIEIMVCTVKPFQLMLGKIIGNALAGLLQFFIWGVLLLGGLFLIDTFLPATEGVDVEKINLIFQTLWEINYLQIVIVFIIFFLSGYLLYSSFYASIGAAVSSETDTQQFVHPILLPLMFAVYIGIVTVVNGNPNGETAMLFSFIPFTSPVIMLMRIPFGVPLWQILVSLALLLVTFIATVFVASKIYRIGILTYGNKPSIKQLFKWVFQKN
ncbi:ABC transporter permease [Wenyingzhuangia sp. 1_MG-2023]|nr:ABC transporter permease [Wenyingzhuangia sp. 1_MG-2023]